MTNKKIKDNNHYRSFMHSATIGCILLDSKLNYIDINKSALKMAHLKRKDIIGKNILDVVPDIKETGLYSKFKKVLRTGSPYSLSRYKPHPKFKINHIELKVFKTDSGLGIIFTDISVSKKIEDELAYHREVMKNIPEGVYLVGYDDAVIRYANRKFEKMFGYNPGEMIGKHVSIVNAPSDIDPVKKADEIIKTIHKTGVWHGEIENIKKDGTHFWCNASVSVFEHDIYGKVMVSVHTDITEQKRIRKDLQKSEDKYRAIFEQAADSIVLVDMKTGKILDFNDRAHKSLGYTRKEFKKLQIADFEVVESPEEVKKHIKKIIKNGFDNFETKHRTKKGDIRNIYVTSKIISIGDKKYIQGIWRDITKHKKVEIELKKHRNQLEKLVKQRTAKLQKSEIKLKKSESRLKKNQKKLENKNIVLSEILTQVEMEKNKIKNKIKANLQKRITPLLQKIKLRASEYNKDNLELLENELNDISSDFGIKISDAQLKLTLREMELCDIIKNGFSNKEAAKMLNLSLNTITSYRKNIRKKLGLLNKDINLATYLKSL